MHQLLERQIRKASRHMQEGQVDYAKLFEMVSQSYEEFEAAQRMKDRAANLMSEELLLKNRQVMEHGNLLEKQIKQRTEELEAAKEQAESASHVKSEFLANMSHEIRTPLNGIIGASAIVEKMPMPEEQKEFVDIIVQSSEILMELVNDVLDISKIEAGKLQLEPISFDLFIMIENLVEMVRPRAQKKNLELIFRFSSELPPYFIGDPGRIRQVLLNFLSNAIKFTETGGISLNVRYKELTHESVLLKFEVSDTGIGIDRNKLELIFEKFSQEDASTTRRYGGTGLGLSISKHLIEMMNGKIGVESEKGKGSIFWCEIRLPLDHKRKVEICCAEDFNGLSAIIVDDSATNLSIYRGIFKLWNIKAEFFQGSAAAIEGMQNYPAYMPIHIGIMDYHMPDMDGFVLTKRLQKFQATKETKWLLLASSPRPGDRSVAEKAGFLGYLRKPFRQIELYEALSLLWYSCRSGEKVPFITRHSLAELRPNLSPKDISLPKLKVLLAEDHPFNQKVAAHMLKGFGMQVDIAVNGEEALQKTMNKNYDIIFMDCQMPIMDGFAATKAIRAAEGKSQHNHIVAMTANAMAGDREKCLAAGMDDYLSKPLKEEKLLEIIKSKP